jgi:hypothetical protein
VASGRRKQLSTTLATETRKARLYLLGVSTVGIAIVWTGLVPQKIVTLGIEFDQANRQALLLILALVVGYFLGTFVIYGAADYLRARYAYLNATWPETLAKIQAEQHGIAVDMAESRFSRANTTRKEVVHEYEQLKEVIKEAKERGASHARKDMELRILKHDLRRAEAAVQEAVEELSALRKVEQ